MAEKVIKVKVDKASAQRDIEKITQSIEDAGDKTREFKEQTKDAREETQKSIPVIDKSTKSTKDNSKSFKEASESAESFARETKNAGDESSKASKKISKSGEEARKTASSFDSAAKKTGSLTSGVESTSGSFSKMIPMASKTAGGIAAVGSAVAAATAATIAFARSQALAIKELQTSARLAGLSTQQFQAYSYAANSFGVSQEKLGDTLKDVNDKVGDFITTGGGEFADVFEKVLKPIGYTTDQLREMSSAEVLGAVQEGLDKLGANGQEATFVLEAIANDATLLQPLLENNSEALNRLAGEAERMGLIISPDQVQAANDFNAAFERTAGKVSTFAKLLTAEMAPALTELVDLAGDFVTYMAEAFNLTTASKIKSVTKEIESLNKAIEDREARGAKKYGDVSILDALNPFSDDTGDTAQMKKRLEELKSVLDELEDEQKRTQDLTRIGISGGDSGGSSGGVITGGGLGGQDDDTAAKELERKKQYLQSWIDNVSTYNLSATELNDAWRQSEIEKAQEWFELNKEKTEEYRQAVNEINKKWASKDSKIREDEQKQQASTQNRLNNMVVQGNMQLAQQSLSFIEQTAKDGSAMQKIAFVASQGLALSQALMNSEVAATAALAAPPIGLGPIAGQALAQTVRAQGYASAAIIGAQTISGLASRQVGGYMNSNTPYQIGGGAHTTDPEIYSSGGKDYLVDSSAGKMTRLDKSSSSAMGAVNFQLINNGSPVDAQITSDSVDEQGVRRIVAEMTPQIMSKEMGDKYSPANQARKRWEKPQESYS